MPNITAILDVNSRWDVLRKSLGEGTPPHALLALIPILFHNDFSLYYARHVLCHQNCACGECRSCMLWQESRHPDLMILGSEEKPATIDECRQIYSFLSLKPFTAKRRVVIIKHVDELSLPAANSLLKTVEEPPEGSCLLCLASKSSILETIKSRCWFFTLDEEALKTEKLSEIPSSDLEWADWFKRNEKVQVADLKAVLDGWVLHLLSDSKPQRAADLLGFSTVITQSKFPVALIQDTIFLALEEGKSIDELLGRIW